MTAKTDKATLLFLLNEEHGQANIHLILAQGLIKQYGESVDIHFCSFSKVGARLKKDNVEGVTFHEVQGKGMMDAWTEGWKERNPGQRAACGAGFAHRPNLSGALRSITIYKPLLIPWSNDEYVRIVHDIEDVISRIKPDLAIIDPLCTFGTDACRQQGVEMICLSPVSWGMNARAMGEVNEKFALKWPAIGSAYPNPVPWYLIPANILQVLFSALWILLISPGMRSWQRARVAAGLSPLHPLVHSPRPILCPGTRALDLPGVHSDGVVPFGPIMHPYPPLNEVDPELDAWLAQGGQGKTLLIVLGSHFRLNAREVRDMMSAVKELMQQREDVQVLWKLKPDEAHAEAKEELHAWIKAAEGRVRVVDWLECDPPALMRTGCIGAFVHHGGGNSYQEALGCGVPQVIVAGWVDCYDFAQRATELGVGIWANKADAPSISSAPLASAFLTILGPTPTDPKAATYARRAKQVALIAQEADTMPLVPVFTPSTDAGAGVTKMRAREDMGELDIVKAARQAAAGANKGRGNDRGDSGIATPALSSGTSLDGAGGKVYVDGRDVAVEWIWRYVAGVKEALAQEGGGAAAVVDEATAGGADEDGVGRQLRERKVRAG